MGIGTRLLASTIDLQGAAPESSFPEGSVQTQGARTAPGQMLAAHSAMRAMQAELESLRARLDDFDGGMPTLRIDAQRIKASMLANRHEVSYLTPSFASLKASIEHSGGNTQPILVRTVADKEYEVVFGHRRHRACLELGLPVLAVLWNGPMSDVELFLAMDRENRERADLSPFEQGTSYLAALASGLFPSQRRLAESLGISHTWVRKTTLVAQLPKQLIECFRSPIEIQPKHAERISTAIEKDRDSVMKRAELIRGKRLSASQVVAELVEQASSTFTRSDLCADGIRIGSLSSRRNNSVVLEIDTQATGKVSLDAVMAAVRLVLSQASESESSA
jgi:ParB family chromosome partitioning protein